MSRLDKVREFIKPEVVEQALKKLERGEKLTDEEVFQLALVTGKIEVAERNGKKFFRKRREYLDDPSKAPPNILDNWIKFGEKMMETRGTRGTVTLPDGRRICMPAYILMKEKLKTEAEKERLRLEREKKRKERWFKETIEKLRREMGLEEIVVEEVERITEEELKKALEALLI